MKYVLNVIFFWYIKDIYHLNDLSLDLVYTIEHRGLSLLFPYLFYDLILINT
jgi:hypothetical protein